MNGALKEIATIVGIDKNLTTHVARHTFATTVCLLNGVSIETVSKALGHTNINTTQIYAKIVPKKMLIEMQEMETKVAMRQAREKRQEKRFKKLNGLV